MKKQTHYRYMGVLVPCHVIRDMGELVMIEFFCFNTNFHKVRTVSVNRLEYA